MELLATAFNGLNAETGQVFDGRRHDMLTVKVIIGSPHDDTLFGNDLGNHIGGKGGSDALTGFGGKDIYILTENTKMLQ